MAVLPMEIDWDFDAGLLPLDFANTAEWHARADPVEKLKTYAHLLAWSTAAGLLSPSEAQVLFEESQRRPEDAKEVLEQAINLREAIYRTFSSLAAGGKPAHQDLAVINDSLADALSRARVEPTGEGYILGWTDEERRLGRMLWPILHATAELLTSEDLKRVGECADDRGCGFLFFDSSRNYSRRWCNMESCGNRAKAQRHYVRKKRGS
jgi:predicted RNA-binding Zn ribbon-like protein